ncbi:MAG: ribonuclease Y [Candidatus Dojkabacteria bacterium]
MDTSFILVAILLVVATVGVLFAVFLYLQLNKLKKDKDSQINDLLSKSKEVKVLSETEAIEKASRMAKETLINAERKALEIQSSAQNDLRNARNQLKDQEKILEERESKLVDRNRLLDQRNDQADKKEQEIEGLKKDISVQREQLAIQLQEVAKLTREEAEKQLKAEVEKDLQDWAAKKIREAETLISQQSDEKAKNILVEAMASAATDYVAETTTTTVQIDDETMKSKIIGKQGRNIRTFEKLTGVDLIVDETPNQVTISCFDPIRREVAALTLQRLLVDGRVHPGSIEETVEKVKKELLKVIKKTGDDMAYETGFNNLPQEIIMLLGRFKYRFSYGQNLVKHTLEMVKIGEALSRELGADVQTTKLACLLHDIGKVAPEEGKQHHHISAELARKYFPKDERLANAIEAHHFDIDTKYIEAEIVRIADAISGARPGARVENYEDYIKRIRALEDIANKHKGVKESFAIYAGREIRVIVRPDEASDEDVKNMSYQIAKEIEDTQNYPGVIKVTVIRETRSVVEAK